MGQSIPGNFSQTEGVSAWRLRERTELTAAQLRRFQEWGFASPNEDGSWPASAEERLGYAKALGGEVFSLPRRLLRFSQRYPVADGQLQRAMVEVARTMARGATKMRRIDKACRVVGSEIGGRHAVWPERRPEASPRPPQRDWECTLRKPLPPNYDRPLGLMSHLDALMLARTAGTTSDVSDIPYEERLTLLHVRDRHAIRERQRKVREVLAIGE